MATIEDFDKELARLKAQMEKVKERKKVALAKEREQNRKWQTECVAALGETILKGADCDWTELDFEGFALWLDENASQLRETCVKERVDAAEAKKQLDKFKTSNTKKSKKTNALESDWA